MLIVNVKRYAARVRTVRSSGSVRMYDMTYRVRLCDVTHLRYVLRVSPVSRTHPLAFPLDKLRLDASNQVKS